MRINFNKELKVKRINVPCLLFLNNLWTNYCKSQLYVGILFFSLSQGRALSQFIRPPASHSLTAYSFMSSIYKLQVLILHP